MQAPFHSPAAHAAPRARPRRAPAASVALAALVALALLLFRPGPAAGQSPSLQMELRPLVPRPRSAAPAPFEAVFTNPSSAILTGRLRIEISETAEPGIVHTTAPLSLAPGKQRVALTLPIGGQETWGGSITLRCRFLLDQGQIDLGATPILTASATDRSLVLAVAAPGGRVSPLHQPLMAALRLERFSPDPASRTVTTTPMRLHIDQMPSTPLGYAAFDALLLADAGFNELSEDQLAAVAAWTRAGGSLCVALISRPPPAHASFLRSLAADPDLPLPLPGEAIDPDAAPVRVYDAELGRLMLVTSPPASAADAAKPPWPEAVARFWKASATQMPRLAAGRPWREDAEVLAPERAHYRNMSRSRNAGDASPTTSPAPLPLSMRPLPLSQGPTLVQSLMPSDLRPVPLGLLVTILAIFLLLIGPGDYFLLGLIRRRVWTWILFPVSCVGCMVVVLLVARAHMGSHDRLSRIEVIDIAADGRPIRQSTLLCIVSGASRDLALPARDSLFQRVHRQWLASPWDRQGSMRGHYEAQGPVAIEGRYPLSYAASLRLAQWSPTLARLTRLAPTDLKPPAIEWDAPDLRAAVASAAGLRAPTPPTPDPELPRDDPRGRRVDRASGPPHAAPRVAPPPRRASRLYDARPLGKIAQSRFDSRLGICVVAPPDPADLDPQNAPETHHIPNAGECRLVMVFNPNHVGPLENQPQVVYNSHRLASWVPHLTGRSREGFFSVVSAIAPNGAGDLEDLSLLDPAAHEAVLVLFEKRGADLFLYRRLFRFQPPPTPATTPTPAPHAPSPIDPDPTSPAAPIPPE